MGKNRFNRYHVTILCYIILAIGNINGVDIKETRSKLAFRGPHGPSAFYFISESDKYLTEEGSVNGDVILPIHKNDNRNYKRSDTPKVGRSYNVGSQYSYVDTKASNLLPSSQVDNIYSPFEDNPYSPVDNTYSSITRKRNEMPATTTEKENKKTQVFTKPGFLAKFKKSLTPFNREKPLLRYKSYVEKHIKRPIKLFKRVINVLKKHSSRSSITPPSYYLFPTNALKHSRVKKTMQHGRRHTDIETKKYHISIYEKEKEREENAIRRSVLKTNAIHKKTIENQILSLVLEKLKKQRAETRLTERGKIGSYHKSAGTLILDAVEENKNGPEELINNIHKGQIKKKRLTNLFVRFMEDLTTKLNLDPLAIAEMMVRRATSKRTHVYRHASKK